MNSQYIFNDLHLDKYPDNFTIPCKSRLIKKDKNWYVGEFKNKTMETWFPWVAGTAEYLDLTDLDKKWAKDETA